MINCVDDLINHLEAVKKLKGGDTLIRVEIQNLTAIPVDTKFERFYNENKTVFIDILCIMGHK